VAAVIGGVLFTVDDRSPTAPETSQPALAPPSELDRMAVYLCSEKSSTKDCRGRDITDRQRQALHERLKSLPEVRHVRYESKKEAYERFTELFKDTPGFIAATKEGDIPDSFRLEVSPGTAPEIKEAITGLPGVDMLVDETAIKRSASPSPTATP
jgi:cell division protein FtsX